MEIGTLISEIVMVFFDAANASLSAIFGREGEMVNDWSVKERIDIKSENVLIMGGASDSYQAIFAVGLDADTYEELTAQPIVEEEFNDIFGEFANTYYALLMDNEKFVDRFGILNQTIPILYTKGVPFLPFISGVQGTVIVNSKKLSIGFAIQHVQS